MEKTTKDSLTEAMAIVYENNYVVVQKEHYEKTMADLKNLSYKKFLPDLSGFFNFCKVVFTTPESLILIPVVVYASFAVPSIIYLLGALLSTLFGFTFVHVSEVAVCASLAIIVGIPALLGGFITLTN